jgi:crotonobetainyl-CoA:carnitine CoA-transferase CaiB-like acyl-CoA transferase
MPAPWLGQHSRTVLSQLGYSEEEMDALFAKGTVFDQHRDKLRPSV